MYGDGDEPPADPTPDDTDTSVGQPQVEDAASETEDDSLEMAKLTASIGDGEAGSQSDREEEPSPPDTES